MGDLGIAVIVEDDLDVRNLLEGVLGQAGFIVHAASDGRTGVQLVRDRKPDVVTLDVGLPDIDGFEVLRRLRGFSDAYVVMLTGRTDEPDVLHALQSGADDYITKPFRPREMRARIGAMLRRPRPGQDNPAPALPQSSQSGPSTAEAAPAEGPFRHNGLTLDARSRTVEVDGEPLILTRSEFDLLHALCRAGGAVLSRPQLVRAVRDDHYLPTTYISDSDERAVEVHIGNLRRKLQDEAGAPRWLQTVRGVGYRLMPSNPRKPGL
ncbi:MULTISPECIES: response regulator transcription factor [unclassified Arthrobacter]|uniref:response regulator transcription factor n=1 Tax=unclassified Arthrobacter TaxID=235627 RepID=UPI001C840CED|nr:response regulator transcription factor [Arthrobacter sp. MAHUQ-56]MBX7443363.1 response regulator transcription factor [Arthrobacter sp. MAHUQ-56]